MPLWRKLSSVIMRAMRQRLPSDSPAFCTSFVPPLALEGSGWRLSPLHPDLAGTDYHAWRSCRARLRQELQWNGWPAESFSLEDNIEDLAEHYREFAANEAWAYSILRDASCIGCLYIEPWEGGAQVAWWLVDDWLDREAAILADIMAWLDRAWPLNRLVWPVRPENLRAQTVLSDLGLRPIDGPLGHRTFTRAATG